MVVLINLINDQYDPSQNFDTNINTQEPHYVGGDTTGVANDFALDGYMAETYFIDGQALSPTDFGEFDEDSGVWKPKQYAGTYGTNGFYLKFNNTGNMGEDSSGNDNTFTPTNLSGTTDVTTDTPTNNFATIPHTEVHYLLMILLWLHLTWIIIFVGLAKMELGLIVLHNLK
jgi:hypothetical protein